jgi:HTH-type transcriptional regulator/antitoxin HigA
MATNAGRKRRRVDSATHVGKSHGTASTARAKHGGGLTVKDSIGRTIEAERYFDLVREFPLRPLRSEADLNRAVDMVNRLIDQPSRTRDEDDYLDVLSDLVEAYETKTIPEPVIAPDAMLRGLLEDRGMTRSELATKAGLGLSTISEIAAGKRPMNRKHMEAIAKALGIRAAAFLA